MVQPNGGYIDGNYIGNESFKRYLKQFMLGNVGLNNIASLHENSKCQSQFHPNANNVTIKRNTKTQCLFFSKVNDLKGFKIEVI